MTSRGAHIERFAHAILDGNGIGAIWQLHLDAAYAYRTGYPAAAAAIVELAEAAESHVFYRNPATDCAPDNPTNSISESR